MNPIMICAHCGRVGYSNNSWDRTCQRHTIKTFQENVILDKKNKVVFYDTNIKLVEKERKRIG